MNVLSIYFMCFMMTTFSCSSNMGGQYNNSLKKDYKVEYVQNIFYKNYKIESKTYYYSYDLENFHLDDTVIIYPICNQIFNLYKDNSFISEIKFPIKSASIKVDTLEIIRYYIGNVGFDKIKDKDVIVFYGASNNDYTTEFLGAADLNGKWISYHVGTMNENLYQYNKDFFFEQADSYSLNKLNSVLLLPFP